MKNDLTLLAISYKDRIKELQEAQEHFDMVMDDFSAYDYQSGALITLDGVYEDILNILQRLEYKGNKDD